MSFIDLRTFPRLDGYVLVDASLVLALFLPYDSRKSDARAFLQHARAEYAAGHAELFISDLAIEESANRIINIQLQAEIHRGLHQATEAHFVARQRANSIRSNEKFNATWLLKLQPVAIAAHVHQVTRFIQDVRAADIVIVEPEMIRNPGFSLVDRMRDCIRNYHLRPADAYHVAVASAIGAASLATLDRDWHSLQTDFTVLGLS